jgi:PAS domain S-box-containing protein
MNDTPKNGPAARSVLAWMELAQDAGDVASYCLDIPSDCASWSRSFYRLYGLDTDCRPSTDRWLAAVYRDDRAMVTQTLQAAIEAGGALDHRFRILHQKTGEIRWIQNRGRVELDRHGRSLALHGTHIDVTSQHLAQAALASSEQEFRNTFEHANVGVAHVSLDGRFQRVNQALCLLLGRDETELSALTFQNLTHPDDLATDLHLVRQVIEGERDSYTMEKRYLRPDGEIIWADLSVSMLRDADGQAVNFVSVVSDIQSRKQAQAQVQLVLGEVDHRIKNLLTVVTAIVTSSARTATSAKHLAAAVVSRLQGIAASHDLLVGKAAGGGGLEALIRRQLEIFTDQATGQVYIDGPPVQLTAPAVHAFGMVLHELATNACKYGALSTQSGRVHVKWRIDATGEALHFAWREQDGPPVPATGQHGFGTKALPRMLLDTLGGAVSHVLAPQGAIFEATIPVSKTIAR